MTVEGLQAIQKFCDEAAFIPGRVIYSRGPHTIYEVDAEEHQVRDDVPMFLQFV